MRMMTTAERDLLVRLSGAVTPGERVQLLRQIEAATVRTEDQGHMSLSVPDHGGAPPFSGIDVIETSYTDEDGATVELLLHFEQPRATISWLEWFRYDGKRPRRFPPTADALTAPVVRPLPS